jgi:hypothetical protein
LKEEEQLAVLGCGVKIGTISGRADTPAELLDTLHELKQANRAADYSICGEHQKDGSLPAFDRGQRPRKTWRRPPASPYGVAADLVVLNGNHRPTPAERFRAQRALLGRDVLGTVRL